MTEPAYKVELSDSGLNDADLEKCVAIIRAGGAVDVTVAKLRRAIALVLAKRGDEIVGVGTVKGSRARYGAGIAKKSVYELLPETPELGYVAVDAAHQGRKLSHRLVGELLRDRNGQLFATTDNQRMKTALSACGFREKGPGVAGPEGQLFLWIRS
jgi:hypothetical protein